MNLRMAFLYEKLVCNEEMGLDDICSSGAGCKK